MSFDTRKPLHYDLLNFGDPNALEAFQKGVDPEKKLKKIEVVIQDTNVRRFYWRHFVKDLEQADNSEKLYRELLKSYRKFKTTQVFKNVAVSFEPSEQEGVLKVLFVPQYHKKLGFSVKEKSLGNIGFHSYGLNAAVTVKNLAGIMDKISLGGNFAYNGKFKYGQYLSYSVPAVYKNHTLNFRFSNNNTYLTQNIKERSQGQMIQLATPSVTYELHNILRTNTIDPIKHSQELLEEQLEPTRKVSLMMGKTFKRVAEDQTWANILNVNGELASVEKTGKFGRFLLKNAFACSPEFIRKRGGRLSQITLENKTLFGIIFPFTYQRLMINDRFHQNPMRGFSDVINPDTVFDKVIHPQAGKPGFEFLGDNKGDDLYLQNTLKVQFNDCPILRTVGANPFLYFTYGYFGGNVMKPFLRSTPTTETTLEGQSMNKKNKRWIEDVQKKSRVSIGVGIERAIKGVTLEAVVNLFTFGAPSDKQQTFQFRCAFME